MAVADRLPDTLWPSEPNVGGHHLTVRYLSIPAFLAVAVAAVAGLLPGLAGPTASGVAALAISAAGLSVLEVRTRTCVGYALVGVDTCPMPNACPPPNEEAA